MNSSRATFFDVEISALIATETDFSYIIHIIVNGLKKL